MHFLTYALVPQLVSALAITQRDTRARALYFVDGANSGCSVASMKINVDDGTLSDISFTSTKQKGSVGLTASTTPGAAAVPVTADPLFSQNSIVVSEDYLFTINAGSNSVSMFTIDPQTPTALTLVNSASSLGQFPMAIAYSSALKTACVMNGGAVAGVTCYSVDHAKGLTPITPLMSSKPMSGFLNQTSPPVGPLGTAGDIQFSPSSKYLLVTLKSQTGATPGANYIFPVINGKVSATPIISQISSMHVNFGFAFLSDSKAVITDASSGYSMVTITPTYQVRLDNAVVVPGQKAICWTAYSSRFNTIFVSDGGHPNITLADPATGAMKGLLVQDLDNKSGLDLALDRNYIYVLTGTNAITVTDLTGLTHQANVPLSSQVQKFVLPGNRAGYAGLAVYPS